ncbi:MAG: hypothetical protein WDW36_009388 [Sanguina aurantia]
MASSSQPVAIARPPRPSASKAQQLGCSPPGPSSYTTSVAPMLGSSPPSASSFKSRSSEKLGPYAAAKNFWNRLIHDSSLVPDEYTVRFIDNVQQQERKSGAEAWSLRVQDKVLELPYLEFAQRFASDIPYHRIMSYRHGPTIIWESDFYKAHVKCGGSEGSPGVGSFGGASARSGLTPLRERSGNIPMQQTTGFLGGSASPGGASNDNSACGVWVAARADHASTGMGKLSLAAREGSCGGGSSGSSRGCSPPPAPATLRGSSGGGGGGGGGGGSPRWGSRVSSVGGATPEGNSSAGSDTDTTETTSHRARGTSGTTPQLQLQRPSQSSLAAGRLSCGEGAGEGALEEADAPSLEVEGPREVPSLPEQCWLTIMRQLGVREVCMMARVSKALRLLSAEPSVWRDCYARLFGRQSQPGSDWGTVRRECRRSQLRAARWMEAEVKACSPGPTCLQCLQMDESKVVSGGGNEVRLWSHEDGRRIATLKGHAARVTCVSFDQQHIISGCAGSLVKVWGMDDLKLRRTLRGHDGPITATATFNSIPLSASKDGAVKLWDLDKAQPILALSAPGGAYAMAADEDSGYLVTAGDTISIYDMTAAQLLHTLEAPTPPQHHRHHSNSSSSHGHQHQDGGAFVDGDGARGVDGEEEDEQLLWLASEGVAAPGAMTQRGSSAPNPFTCVSYSGKLLAAGRAGGVVLWDPRTTHVIAQLDASAVAAAARPIAAATAAATATATPFDFPSTLSAPSLESGSQSAFSVVGGGSSGGGPAAAAAAAAGPPRCVGVQLDEWKLVVGFQDGSHSLTVHDTRAVSGRAGSGGNGSYARGSGIVQGWEMPVQILTAPSQINSFQFHGELLLAGLDSGADCVGWRFTAPAHGRPAAGDGGDGHRGGGGLGKKAHKKPPKVTKPMRFPKRQY